jgi:nitroreductase
MSLRAAEERAAMLRAIEGRRSVRRFLPDPVPEALAIQLVELAIAAPSASNKQPWKFLLLSSRATIRALAELVREATAEVARHVPPESEPAFRAYGDYFTRFEDAPLVIVPIYKAMTILSNLVDAELPPARKDAVTTLEQTSGLAGAAMALQNLLLGAHVLGLGASGMTGPLLAEDSIKRHLEIPTSWHVLALVPVGYPAEIPAPPGRKGVEKVIRWIR